MPLPALQRAWPILRVALLLTCRKTEPNKFKTDVPSTVKGYYVHTLYFIIEVVRIIIIIQKVPTVLTLLY